MTDKIEVPPCFIRLVEAARGLRHGSDWNNGTHAKLHGYRQKLLDALNECDALLREAAPQPAVGEEIMVNTPYDVFTLPLQPSGLDGKGPRFVVHVPGPEQPAAPGAPVGMGDIIEAFDEISGLCRHLRQGGPAPEDLQDLSAALDEAVDIAANMLHAITQQPAGVEEISEDDIANIAWETGFCLGKEDAEGEPTEDWQWLSSEGENMFPDLVEFSLKIAALAASRREVQDEA